MKPSRQPPAKFIEMMGSIRISSQVTHTST
ncbi:hypothetical protein J2W23_001326 [Variovorax boronicumulans]|nr:hypothetical protein [Variovorax boronicumulans]